ncbi:MAG: hypothetical protein ACI4VJ_04055 [Methanosphaera sp.]
MNKIFKITTNNKKNLETLKKVTKIETGTPTSEAKIINVALSEFFRQGQDNSNFNEQLEVLKWYNII